MGPEAPARDHQAGSRLRDGGIQQAPKPGGFAAFLEGREEPGAASSVVEKCVAHGLSRRAAGARTGVAKRREQER